MKELTQSTIELPNDTSSVTRWQLESHLLQTIPLIRRAETYVGVGGSKFLEVRPAYDELTLTKEASAFIIKRAQRFDTSL